MANRYWVGGSGTWDGTSTTHWSASSGGASGASVPTNVDSVFFDQATTYTVTMTGSLSCVNMTVSAGVVTFTGSGAIGIFGNMSLISGTIWNATGDVGFRSGTNTIATNGTVLPAVTFGTAVAGTWQLLTALTVGPSSASARTTLTNGTIDLNGNTFTTGYFVSNNSNTRSIAFNGGKIVCNHDLTITNTLWDTSTVTGFTITGTPSIDIYLTSNATSGGVLPGAASPVNSLSFNFIATVASTALNFLNAAGYAARDVNFSNSPNAISWGARTANSTIYGNLTLLSGMTYGASTGTMSLVSTSGTKTITCNGITINQPLNFSGIGGTFQLQDALLMGSTRTLTHYSGTIDLNGKTLTVGTSYVTQSGTKDLTFNGGTLVCPAAATTAFNNANPTGFTTTAGTGVGKISMTAATAKTFVGGGSTFNCTLSNDGAGALTISGANTFTNIANGVQPTSFVFPIATTQTVTNWNVRGTAGNLVTITSGTAGTPALLSKASGTVSSNYLSLKDSTATGGATWYAGANSTNVSGNLGWIFSNAPTGNFFFMF